ncbi:IS3 family transposase [Paenibacillus thiaminolyticus]|uniref:Transposase n=1 Tax=Paenibacillus thiaminolyticus TaxID=49283 RepID=A0A3A3GDI5_PANTH|nr:transposase [Paenibacillus thiaminolyticus]
MTRFLRDQAHEVNRKRVRRLMQIMGLEAIYPKPNLSRRLHSLYKRPYLLFGLNIDRPNHVWGVYVSRDGQGIHVPLSHHRLVQREGDRLRTVQYP